MAPDLPVPAASVAHHAARRERARFISVNDNPLAYHGALPAPDPECPMRATRPLATLLASVLLSLAATAAAQTPEGRWKTIDDETGKVKSIVEITRARDGRFQGRVVEILSSSKGPEPTCDDCKGANKGRPIKGMTILWDIAHEGGGEYGGGRILDPGNGKAYKSKLEMLGPDRLGVSGCIAFFCRQQEWIRE